MRRLIGITLALITSTLAGTAASEELLRAPLGQLVDIGTHRLHLFCQGQGSPTVVFESGLGGTALEWTELQATVATVTRACVYDRAGYGWSEPGPLPRTAVRLADELHRLLAAAGIDDGITLVAHSFGGYVAQTYARAYPADLAALILVDSSHPGQLATFPVQAGALCAAIDQGLPVRYRISPHLPEGFPADYRLTALAQMLQPTAARTQMSELCNFATSAAEAARGAAFPSLPLIVVSRGKAEFPTDPRGRRLEGAWSDYQVDLARLSPTAQHVIARLGGHHVHLDRPEIVRRATMTSVLMARRASEDLLVRGIVLYE